jgi:hypothetical protein
MRRGSVRLSHYEDIMKRFAFGLLLVPALLFAQGAGAFTIDTTTPRNADGSMKFVDPDRTTENLNAPATNGSAPGTKSFRSGNTTFSFGVTRQDDRPLFGRATPFNNFGSNRNLRDFNRD